MEKKNRAVERIILLFIFLILFILCIHYGQVLDNYKYTIGGLICLSISTIILIDYINYTSLLVYVDIPKKKDNLYIKIKEILSKHFKEDEFFTEDEKEDAKEDCEAFCAYDCAIEEKRNEVSEYDIICNDVFKMKYKNREIDFYINEWIDIVNYHEKIKCIDFGTLKEIDSEKRLHIGVKKSSDISLNIGKFEDVFEDYKEFVEEFDKRNGKKYAYVFCRKYNEKKFKNTGDNIYMQLNDSQKQFLLELYKQTQLRFFLALENGVMRIRLEVPRSYLEDKDMTEEIIAKNVVNIFVKLIEKF